MKHFDIANWTDFIRGLAGEADRAAMEGHLASGCPKCRHTVELLRKLAAAARDHAQIQTPQYALHCAQAIFTLQQPEKVEILARIPARLLYDSFREPLPAGLRTQQRLSRQALYQSGDYSLDLRLENERGSSRVALVGQIQNRKQPGKHLGGVPVLLVSGKQILAQVVSNSLGEFQMEYAPTKRLRLYVPARQAGKRIEVPLDKTRTEKRAQGKASAKQISSSKRGRKSH